MCLPQEFAKKTTAQQLAAGVTDFDPAAKAADQRVLGQVIAQDVVNRLHDNLVVSPTAIVSTLLIDAPAGMTWKRMVQQTGWLCKEILDRNGTLLHPSLMPVESARRGVHLLGNHVEWDDDATSEATASHSMNSLVRTASATGAVGEDHAEKSLLMCW